MIASKSHRCNEVTLNRIIDRKWSKIHTFTLRKQIQNSQVFWVYLESLVTNKKLVGKRVLNKQQNKFFIIGPSPIV